MYFYKLTLEYNGSRYSGWQIQPNVDTVQGELNKALKLISKTEEVSSLAGGRTDAGVHALGQVVRIGIPFEIEVDALTKGLNSLTANDINIVKAEFVSESFHPIRDSKYKEYVYCFSNNKKMNSFQESFLPNISYDLDINLMKKACLKFIGKHDFQNFFCTGTPVKTTEREIYKCELSFDSQSSFSSSILPSHFKMTIVGNGFLKQMVRLIMGCIWEVGKGKVSLEDLDCALSQKLVHRPFPVAPASGLYLHYFQY